MASIYHPRYPTGKRSPYYNLHCYTCKKVKRPYRLRLTYPDGQRVANERDAKKAARDHEVRCASFRHGSSPVTFEHAMRQYLDETATRRKPGVQRRTASLATRLIASFGDKPLMSLTPGVIREGLNRMQREHPAMGATTRDHYLVLLRSVARWCLTDHGYLSQEFTHGVERVGIPRRRVPLPRARWEEFLRKAKSSKYYPGLVFVQFTGVRPEEASQLDWRDVDWKAKVVTIRAEVSKTKRIRRIGLATRVVKALRPLAQAEGRMFDYYWPRVQRQVHTWLKAMGIQDRQLGLYNLRHGFGTHAVTVYLPFQVRDMMGHTSIQTTERYIHLHEVPVTPKDMNKL